MGIALKGWYRRNWSSFYSAHALYTAIQEAVPSQEHWAVQQINWVFICLKGFGLAAQEVGEGGRENQQEMGNPGRGSEILSGLQSHPEQEAEVKSLSSDLISHCADSSALFN